MNQPEADDIRRLAALLHDQHPDDSLAEALAGEAQRLNETIRRSAAALDWTADPFVFASTLRSLKRTGER